MSNDLRDLFKKELDQIPLRPADTWVPQDHRRRLVRGFAWRASLAIAAAVVVLIAAVIGGRQLASFRERIAGEPGVIAGKAIYLSPSFNGSGWIQIDPITLRDVTGKPLMDIPPTNANNDDTTISADGSTIIVGEFTAGGARRSVYDGRTGQLRGYLTPEVPMVIDYLSADGRSALGRLGTTSNALTDPKAIISTETGLVMRTVAAGPALWTYGVIVAPDLSAIYYIVTAVPLTETSLDVSVQQPLSLVVQATADGKLSAPVALPAMTWGNLLSASPPKSVGTSAALSPDRRQLAFLSYDGVTLDLVDTGSLSVTTRNVHRKTSLWDHVGPLVADGKELIDQQWIDMRFTPDGTALMVITTDIHYGADSPTRTTRGIRRIELASAEITADVSPTGGIYSTLISPDGDALFLVVRSQEPPNAAYVLRRLDARSLELKAERALPEYAELKLVAAPAPREAWPSPTLPPATQPSTSCSQDRLVYLVEQFFARYNAHHSADLLQLFNFHVAAAGSGFEDYFDSPGIPVHITDAGKLLTYWESRFATGDRFDSHTVSYPPEGATRFTGNPTAVFTRSFAGGTQQGNMQLDCNSGLLVAVRMSSDYAGWGSREAFGVRFSVPSSWKGPEDIDTQKGAGAPKNWLAFTDANGEPQVTVWLFVDISAETFVATRMQGSDPRSVTIGDAGQTRDVIEVHAPATWSGPTGSGSYDNRHLVVQLSPSLVADVIVNAPRINGPSSVTAEQILIQDRIAVRIASVN